MKIYLQLERTISFQIGLRKKEMIILKKGNNAVVSQAKMCAFGCNGLEC